MLLSNMLSYHFISKKLLKREFDFVKRRNYKEVSMTKSRRFVVNIFHRFFVPFKVKFTKHDC